MTDQEQKLKELRRYGDRLVIVGIDVARTKHWARIVDNDGVNLRKPFQFHNSRSGMQSLVDLTERLGRVKAQAVFPWTDSRHPC